MSEEHSLKSEKKSESEASVPGEKTEEEEKMGGGVIIVRSSVRTQHTGAASRTTTVADNSP